MSIPATVLPPRKGGGAGIDAVVAEEQRREAEADARGLKAWEEEEDVPEEESFWKDAK